MSLRALVVTLLFVVSVLLVIVVVLSVQVGSRNKDIREVKKSTAKMELAVDRIDGIVNEFKRAGDAQAKALGTDAIVAHLQQDIDNGRNIVEIKMSLQELVDRLKATGN
ncbi:MAG TPA: hypothetical protein VLE97_07940 [Gaiellaceae bacterium]|nr:hypothetical protein [Gaiellaceae bacterium]